MAIGLIQTFKCFNSCPYYEAIRLGRMSSNVPPSRQITPAGGLQVDGDITLMEVELSGPVPSPGALDPEGRTPLQTQPPVSLDNHGRLSPQQEFLPLSGSSPGRLDTDRCPLLDVILEPVVRLGRLTAPPPVLHVRKNRMKINRSKTFAKFCGPFAFKHLNRTQKYNIIIE